MSILWLLLVVDLFLLFLSLLPAVTARYPYSGWLVFIALLLLTAMARGVRI